MGELLILWVMEARQEKYILYGSNFYKILKKQIYL